MSKKNRKPRASGESVVASPAVDLSGSIAQLRNAWAETAIEAAEHLGTSNDDRAVAPLLEVLTNENGYFHVVTRAAAAMALGKLGRSSTIDSLLFACHDASSEVACEAILALGAMKAIESINVLTEIVQNPNDDYPDVTRHAAIRALGNIGAARRVLEAVADNAWETPAIVAAARDAMNAR